MSIHSKVPIPTDSIKNVVPKALMIINGFLPHVLAVMIANSGNTKLAKPTIIVYINALLVSDTILL
jgi:hypothetical protein